MDDMLPDAVSVTVPSNPKYLRFIRHLMALFIEDLPYHSIEAHHIVLAVDEACSNVIKYAYDSDETKSIVVTFSCTKDTLKVIIRDFGKKPDLEKIKPRALDDLRPGGLGTHIINSVMDKVDYDLSPEEGTILTLLKSITPVTETEHE